MSWRCRMSALMWSNGWRAQGNQSVESSATLRCGEEVGQMRLLMSALKRGGPGAPPELLQARRVAPYVMLRHGSFLEKAEIFDHSFFGITAKQAAFSCSLSSDWSFQVGSMPVSERRRPLDVFDACRGGVWKLVTKRSSTPAGLRGWLSKLLSCSEATPRRR